MPAVNPFIESPHGQLFTTGHAGAAVVQGELHRGLPMNPANAMNAAGTSENISAHCAIIVSLALAGILLFRQGGFRFVAAAGGAASAGITR